MANPFHQLKRQRERMSVAARMARRYGATTLAERYAIRLNGWATTCRAGDADWLAGMIGPNGIGPALDDVSASVRFARHHPIPVSAPHSPSADVAPLADRDFLSAASFMGRAA